MMQKIILLIVLQFYVNLLYSNERNSMTTSCLSARDSVMFGRIISKNDTLISVTLSEALVYPRSKSKAWSRRHERRQTRLEYNVRKVYPYAVRCARIIEDIDYNINQVATQKEKERIIKEEYSKLMKTFKVPLMQLTITQGAILMRLIDRETNATSFNHIREYKGAVNAYFWQSLALLFGNNLKKEYDPHGADKEIEKIVLKIQAENLK